MPPLGFVQSRINSTVPTGSSRSRSKPSPPAPSPQVSPAGRLTELARELSPQQDHRQIDLLLETELRETGTAHATNPHVASLYQRLATFVLQGGKRLRPRLCLASFRILTESLGQAPPDSIWKAATSLEIFHAFMLVHDDLIDASVSRRGQPTLHEAIRLDEAGPDTPQRRKRAADLGLIGGDLLYAIGLRMLAQANLPAELHVRVTQRVTEILLETGIGQTLDVLFDDCSLDDLNEADLVEAYVRKTSRYSVSGPLVLGALLAGAEESVCRSLQSFGDLLGFAYQVRNDLDSLEEDLKSGDHADLDGGKRTFVLWTAHQFLEPAGRQALEEVLAAPVSVARRRLLRDLIHHSGAVQACRARIEASVTEAVMALSASSLNQEQREAFVALTGLFSPWAMALTLGLEGMNHAAPDPIGIATLGPLQPERFPIDEGVSPFVPRMSSPSVNGAPSPDSLSSTK